jgi:GT2 family glycosyltransferase
MTIFDLCKRYLKRQLLIPMIRRLGLADSRLFHSFFCAILHVAPVTEAVRFRLKREFLEETKQDNQEIYEPEPEAKRQIKPVPLLKPHHHPATFAKTLRFPHHDQPLVSVIIPVYNQLEYTLCCLHSIANHLPAATVEIIVVNDCSTDESLPILSRIPGLTLISNETNLNFLRSANHGARHARGQFLLFLNNDTQVQAGWLDCLLDVFTDHPDAGLAGSKVIYPSGHLQEAGSRMKQDGSAVMIGLNDDPEAPHYNYLREVDYCSGVSLLIRANLFNELQGFDEYYAPCYYEDADLAYRVRALGKKVYYQPKSVICHHLSVSTANRDGLKMKSIQRNKEKFLLRWQKQIQQQEAQLRLIAFYLPQFHPIPENDEWWGEGFTEWTNTRRARANFKDHYQPKTPGELGYYDLRDDTVREQQITLARQYGINAFCYYYYWFNGKKLLETPIEMLHKNKALDFPFCLCWANEDWTRTWDGESTCILMKQEYCLTTYQQFIEDVYPLLADDRYLKINGSPVLMIYRASKITECGQALQLWRSYCIRQGLPGLYLVSVDSFGEAVAKDHYSLGFDAIVEFPPHAHAKYYDGDITITNPDFAGRLFDYEQTRQSFMERHLPANKLFRCAMPSWDNTARRQNNPDIFLNASPERYQKWLEYNLEFTHNFHCGEEKLAFVNAWNEWAEGNYLEPDEKNGLGYLQKTLAARSNLGG